MKRLQAHPRSIPGRVGAFPRGSVAPAVPDPGAVVHDPETRLAEAYGSACITWATSAVNGFMPVDGSHRPKARALRAGLAVERSDPQGG